MKIKDVVKILKKMPQNMEVYGFWDEGGTYHPQTRPPEIVEIVWSKKHKNFYENGHWKEKSKKYKRICRLDG